MAPILFKRTNFYKKHKYRLARANDLLSFFSALCLIFFLVGDQSHMALKRHALSNEIQFSAILTGLHSGIYSIDDRVIRAMAQVPRHDYVNRPYQNFAYFNVALPVDGQDYMIPEPFVTAIMVHLMNINENDNVLEVGFGYGYDAAVIAKLAKTVHSVRQSDGKFDELSRNIKSPAPALEKNIHIKKSKGLLGWPEAGPYDSILVRQSMTEPPLALLKQLKPGGRMIIPIGPASENQRLMVYERKLDGSIASRSTLHMKISPLLKGTEI